MSPLWNLACWKGKDASGGEGGKGMIRRWMCRWFSLHDMETILRKYKGNYELCRCRHCGLDAAVHNETRKVLLMSWP